MAFCAGGGLTLCLLVLSYTITFSAFLNHSILVGMSAFVYHAAYALGGFAALFFLRLRRITRFVLAFPVLSARSYTASRPFSHWVCGLLFFSTVHDLSAFHYLLPVVSGRFVCPFVVVTWLDEGRYSNIFFLRVMTFFLRR